MHPRKNPHSAGQFRPCNRT